MKVVLIKTNNDTVSIQLDSSWHYEVRFEINSDPTHGILVLADESHKILENQDMIDYYHQLTAIDSNDVANIQIIDDDDSDLLFDATRLQFEYVSARLEYVSSNVYGTRPGTGMLMLFTFNNHYVI